MLSKKKIQIRTYVVWVLILCLKKQKKNNERAQTTQIYYENE